MVLSKNANSRDLIHCFRKSHIL